MRPFGGLLIGLAVFRACVGLFILIVYNPQNLIADEACLAAFAIAQITDQLDGWIARRFSRPSVEGYLQDSVADKLLHIGCLLAFTRYYPWVGVFVWFVCVREISILAMRVIVSDLDKMLREYRYQSIIYAIALRLGIVTFLSLPFALVDPWSVLAVSYSLLALASLLGMWNAVAVVRGMARSGFRPP